MSTLVLLCVCVSVSVSFSLPTILRIIFTRTHKNTNVFALLLPSTNNNLLFTLFDIERRNEMI